MGVLTRINKIPLFSTKREALVWAESNGLKGYHTHEWKRRVGYMGGFDHKAAAERKLTRSTRQSIPTPTPTPTPAPAQPTPIQNRRTVPQPIPEVPTRSNETIDPILPSTRRTGGASGGGGGGY